MDEVGFWAMEVWGGATFDACLRFLKEDPWHRLKALRKALPNTQLSMLLRGQNLLGYRHYADDVVQAFIKQASTNGVDVFRVFDALNDFRNLETALKAIKANHKHAQGAISYTISPVHTLDNFVELGKQLAEMGCDSLAIKDMAGLLTPTIAVDLYKALAKTTGLPIHIHTHYTSGLANICLYEAVLAGCNHIDTAMAPFSGGASHSATESMVAAFANTPFDSQLDLNLLLEIGEHFKTVRKKYHQFESEANEIDPRVQLYQVPGGMISNLYNQLKEQGALDKASLVFEEILRVRKDLGYPPLVTPTSQIVGTQAVLNVLSGTRYHSITNEVKLYCQGKYGKPPGRIDSNLRKKAIGSTEMIEVRPADLIPSEMNRLKHEIGDLAKNNEDLLSYAMFPQIGKKFLEQRHEQNLQLSLESSEPLEAIALDKQESPTDFKISLHGEIYHIKIAGYGKREKNQQACFLWVDGVPEEVLIELDSDSQDINSSPKDLNQERKNLPREGDIHVAMPSTVVSVSVSVGDKIKLGQALLVVEAMKMETEVQAPFNGTIDSVECKPGDKVIPAQVLMHICKEE